jgi:hypothetical protein
MIDPNDYTPEVYEQLKAEFPEQYDPANWTPAPPTPPEPPKPPPTPAEFETIVLDALPTAAHVAILGPNLKDGHYAALGRLIARGDLPGPLPDRAPPREPIDIRNRPRDTGPDEATPQPDVPEAIQ